VVRFPQGHKWENRARGRDSAEPQIHRCNERMEGDSGSIATAMIMESDPFTLIEGMIIAGLALGQPKALSI